MKICMKCGEENEDSYLYCVSCTNKLPRKNWIEREEKATKDLVDRGNYKEGFRKAKQVLELNRGSWKAWLFQAICAQKMHMVEHSRECFEGAGVKFHFQGCTGCSGKRICEQCGEEGRCIICRGTGNCPICSGAGTCIYCEKSNSNCRACGNTRTCRRCGGRGLCPKCGGKCSCPYCGGKKKCHICGGTGQEMVLNMESIPPEFKKYFQKKH